VSNKRSVRRWRPIREIAEIVVKAYLNEGDPKNGMAAAADALSKFMMTERKISRLTEQLKDAVVSGGLTDVAVVSELFRDIYKQSTLRGVDEEGRPLV